MFTSHMLSTTWSCCRHPSSLVCGQLLTIWSIICHCHVSRCLLDGWPNNPAPVHPVTKVQSCNDCQAFCCCCFCSNKNVLNNDILSFANLAVIYWSATVVVVLWFSCYSCSVLDRHCLFICDRLRRFHQESDEAASKSTLCAHSADWCGPTTAWWLWTAHCCTRWQLVSLAVGEVKFC